MQAAAPSLSSSAASRHDGPARRRVVALWDAWPAQDVARPGLRQPVVHKRGPGARAQDVGAVADVDGH